MEQTNRSAWNDAAIACLLAAALVAAWSWRDWANLSSLRLPDSDDMMRLQQIRDWLNGQSFADVSQHRLGADGVAMHWSRLADLVPAWLIWTLQGPIGRHAAEIAAVIVWPTMLLAATIALIARIARHLGGAAIVRPATIVAAIAYPASTLFLPGRIDHHNLQLVLLLVTTLMLLRRGSVSAGLIAGAATSLSIVVGMETVPLLGVAATVMVVDWAIGGVGTRERLTGFGAALFAVTLGSSIVFRTTAWDYAACDGFTAISARAAMIAALAPLGVALAGREASSRVRLALAATSAVVLAAAIGLGSPQCLSPYGTVDPLLQQLWLTRVGEAQALFAAPLAVAIGYCGLALAGIAAGGWQLWRTRARGWAVMFALQLAAIAITLLQLRGAYAGALLAAPALGALIVAARQAGALPLAGAWLASAGMLYPIAAQALTPPVATAAGADCAASDLIEALRELPVGTVMAPIDSGGPAIARTGQRLIAGAYHRDGAGDLAMYAFYRGSPDQARAIANQWRVTYVVACDGFIGVAAPFSAMLNRGDYPAWLRVARVVPSGGRIFTTTGLSIPGARP